MKVICDTMIWYGIGNKIISVPDKNKFQLVATFINLHELLHSTRILYKFNYLQNACRAIFDNASEIFLEQPIVYIHNIANPINKIKSSDSYVKDLDVVACLDNNNFSEERKLDFENKIKEYHQNTNDSFINPASILIEKCRTHIENDNIKIELAIDDIKKSIYHIIKNNYPNFIIKKKDFWIDIGLFLNSYREFFLNRISNNKSLENNDKTDLLNLVYVNKNSLYWTKDNEVKSTIKKTSFKNYLFET